MPLAGEAPRIAGAPVSRRAYRIVRGGFPDAWRRSDRQRARYFASYVQALLARDLPDVRFKAGIVLHTGANTLTLEDRIHAVPLQGLWS